jgi:hypothetical protein
MLAPRMIQWVGKFQVPQTETERGRPQIGLWSRAPRTVPDTQWRMAEVIGGSFQMHTLIAGSNTQGGLALWTGPVFGGAAAAVLVLITAVAAWLKPPRTNGTTAARNNKNWLLHEVKAGSVWSGGDSWATNISAVGAVLGTIIGSAGVLKPIISVASSAAVTGLFITFGGAAALAPIVYAALARKPDETVTASVGTRLGLFLAGAVTLFATFGELATIALLTWQLDASEVERYALVAAPVLASFAISVYSTRSLRLLAIGNLSPARGSLLGQQNNTSGTL